MSEHKHNWRIGDNRNSKRRRVMNKFPRHSANKTEATHLSMNYHPSKNNRYTNDNFYSKGFRNGEKMRLGLIRKFIGKPFNDLMSEINKRIDDCIDISVFKRTYFTEFKRKWQGHRRFIIKDGLIQYDPEYKEFRYARLNDYQKIHNQKVIIPDFGVCRNDSPIYDIRNMEWINTGKFIKNELPVVKIPKVYFVLNNKVVYDNVYICLAQQNRYLDTLSYEKKRNAFLKEYTEIFVPGLKNYQAVYKFVKNPEYRVSELEGNNMSEIDIPEFIRINVGAGRIKFFIKKN